MADVLHKTLPDSELHESKGVSGAGQGSVYKANGTGSGSWQKIDPTMLQGMSNNGAAGQALLLDGQGGFTSAASTSYIYGAAITTPSSGEENQLIIPLRPTNNLTQTLASNISISSHRFVFAVGGLYQANFTISAYNSPEATEVIKTLTAAMGDGTIIGAIANDSKSSTSVSFIFRAASNNTLELRKLATGLGSMPGVLVQYAINKIGV